MHFIGKHFTASIDKFSALKEKYKHTSFTLMNQVSFEILFRFVMQFMLSIVIYVELLIKN